jgi:hypothetical protein
MKRSAFILLITLLAISFVPTVITTAGADLVTATLTADNHYGLYYGDGQGNVTFVGRNELGTPGTPGDYNWSLPEQWKFNVTPGEYIYVAAWNETQWKALIGQFVLPSTTILTDSTNWQVYRVTPSPPLTVDGYDPAPTPSEMFQYIGNANTAGWGSITDSQSQGSYPWGVIIPGIDSNAKWIWGSAMYGDNDSEYQIFRTQVPAVPIPAAVWLLGSGLVGLLAIRRKL